MMHSVVIPGTALEPLLVDATGAARLCGVSRSFWMQLHAADRVPRPLRLGRRVLWRVDELHRWVAAGMPSAEQWGRMVA